MNEGAPESLEKSRKRGRTRNAPTFYLRTRLLQMCGVDLTRIDSIEATTALPVISPRVGRVGADMSRDPTGQQRVSLQAGWGCALAPGPPVGRS